MTDNVRKLGNKFLIFEDTSLENLRERMKNLLKQGTFKLNHKYGYTINENITHYENVVDGKRYQGILERC